VEVERLVRLGQKISYLQPLPLTYLLSAIAALADEIKAQVYFNYADLLLRRMDLTLVVVSFTLGFTAQYH
jgi:hypothetical protein